MNVPTAGLNVYRKPPADRRARWEGGELFGNGLVQGSQAKVSGKRVRRVQHKDGSTDYALTTKAATLVRHEVERVGPAWSRRDRQFRSKQTRDNIRQVGLAVSRKRARKEARERRDECSARKQPVLLAQADTRDDPSPSFLPQIERDRSRISRTVATASVIAQTAGW